MSKEKKKEVIEEYKEEPKKKYEPRKRKFIYIPIKFWEKR